MSCGDKCTRLQRDWSDSVSALLSYVQGDRCRFGKGTVPLLNRRRSPLLANAKCIVWHLPAAIALLSSRMRLQQHDIIAEAPPWQPLMLQLKAWRVL